MGSVDFFHPMNILPILEHSVKICEFVTFFISKIPIFALIFTVFHSFENLWLYL
jgi:hypothetical protein